MQLGPDIEEINCVNRRLFKNVVAQFIGRLCLMNQATTKIWG